MLGELAGQELLVDAGAVAGALLAIGAVVAASLAMLRRALRHEIRPVVEQFAPNGGSSLRDAVDRLEASQARQDDRLERIEERLSTGDDRMGSIEHTLGDFAASHPEIRRDP